MAIVINAQVEHLSDHIRITADEHVLRLPITEGPFQAIRGSGSAVYVDGLFIVIERHEGSLIAYDEVTGEKLWVIPPQQVTPAWKSGFICLNAYTDKEGKPHVGFNTSFGHAYGLTDIRKGTFRYIRVAR